MTQLASVANNLKVWTWEDDSSELVLKSTFRAPASPVNCAAWNHTNQVIALGGKEPKINLVQANNGQQLSSLILSESKLSQFKVSAVAFSHHSRFIATSIDTPVQMWDLKKRQIISIFTGHKQPIVSLDFNTNSDIFAADGSGNTCLWSIKSPTPNTPLQTFTDSISEALFTLTCMKLSLNGQYVASGFENGSVKLWETSSMSGEVYRTMTGHSNKVSAIAWSPKNTRLLATVSTDEKLNLIDINASPGAAGKGICAEVHVEQRCSAVSFHENGVHTAVGTMDGGIILYDWRNTRKPVLVMNCHNPFPVNALCFQVPSTKPTDAVKTTTSTDPLTTTSSSSTAAATNSLSQAIASPRGVSKPIAKSTHRDDPTPTSSSSDIPTRVSFAADSFAESNQQHHVMDKTKKIINDMIDNNFEENYPTNGASVSATATAPYSPSSSSTGYKGTISKSQAANVYEEDRYPSEELPHPPKHHQQHHQPQSSRTTSSSTHHSALNTSTATDTSLLQEDDDEEDLSDFMDLKQAVKPVTSKQLEESLELLRYDIHREVQEIIKEQVRQFSIAKEETTEMFKELSNQLQELIQANKELRAENEYLRKIY